MIGETPNPKKFRRFNLQPQGIARLSQMNPDLEDHIAVEIDGHRGRFAYLFIPVSTWKNESALMDLVQDVAREARI